MVVDRFSRARRIDKSARRADGCARSPAATAALVAASMMLAFTSIVARAQLGVLPLLQEREWYYEDEFARTPGLRAEPRHAVILELERSSSGDDVPIVRS